MKGRVLIEGEGAGPLLRLTAPLSFWGGVDPKTGRVSDPRHPQNMLLGGGVHPMDQLRAAVRSEVLRRKNCRCMRSACSIRSQACAHIQSVGLRVDIVRALSEFLLLQAVCLIAVW